jgi:hypothetical protein
MAIEPFRISSNPSPSMRLPAGPAVRAQQVVLAFRPAGSLADLKVGATEASQPAAWPT